MLPCASRMRMDQAEQDPRSHCRRTLKRSPLRAARTPRSAPCVGPRSGAVHARCRIGPDERAGQCKELDPSRKGRSMGSSAPVAVTLAGSAFEQIRHKKLRPRGRGHRNLDRPFRPRLPRGIAASQHGSSSAQRGQSCASMMRLRIVGEIRVRTPLSRNTLRKRILHRVYVDVFDGKPALIDEMRWRVLSEEFVTTGRDLQEMGIGHLKSFCRTLRSHSPQFAIHRIGSPHRIPSGILARAAVYRLKTRGILAEFLESPSPTVCFRLNTIVVPSVHSQTEDREVQVVACELYPRCPTKFDGTRMAEQLSVLVFPISSPLFFVGPPELGAGKPLELPIAPCRLYRASGGVGKEFDPTRPVKDPSRRERRRPSRDFVLLSPPFTKPYHG